MGWQVHSGDKKNSTKISLCKLWILLFRVGKKSFKLIRFLLRKLIVRFFTVTFIGSEAYVRAHTDGQREWFEQVFLSGAHRLNRGSAVNFTSASKHIKIQTGNVGSVINCHINYIAYLHYTLSSFTLLDLCVMQDIVL